MPVVISEMEKNILSEDYIFMGYEDLDKIPQLRVWRKLLGEITQYYQIAGDEIFATDFKWRRC